MEDAHNYLQRFEAWKTKAQRRAKRYTVHLMNNTKWREVFDIMIDSGVPLEAMLIGHDQPVWQKVSLTKEQLLEEHIADPGIGGPCLYMEILAVRFPIVEELVNEQTGRTFTSNHQSADLQEQLFGLGQLPLFEIDGYCEIRAYAS